MAVYMIKHAYMRLPDSTGVPVQSDPQVMGILT